MGIEGKVRFCVNYLRSLISVSSVRAWALFSNAYFLVRVWPGRGRWETLLPKADLAQRYTSAFEVEIRNVAGSNAAIFVYNGTSEELLEISVRLSLSEVRTLADNVPRFLLQSNLTVARVITLSVHSLHFTTKQNLILSHRISFASIDFLVYRSLTSGVTQGHRYSTSSYGQG